ncbi:hypothetical protein [Rhizobium laguerreae]|uniref:hypothetical protein n=1 Tax=Rhizobium laguerreae TaxID=1076926 RepID=UPI001C908477|nr:hypothetical protein [Rhizobium laguerreae]
MQQAWNTLTAKISAGGDRQQNASTSSELKNLLNLVFQFRFGQHSFAKVIDNRNDASPSAKPSRGMKAKLVRANGGASASALAYDSWEEF